MGGRIGVVHDHPPEDVPGMIQHIQLVKPIPVIFNEADCLFSIFGEQVAELLLRRGNDPLGPHDVADQVEEVTQTKTIELD